MQHKQQEQSIVKVYLVVALFLCVLTFAEWSIIHWEMFQGNPKVIVPSLVAMSMVKFMLVAGWYMHLHYDHGWLRRLFASAFLLSVGVFAVVCFVV